MKKYAVILSKNLSDSYKEKIYQICTLLQPILQLLYKNEETATDTEGERMLPCLLWLIYCIQNTSLSY